MSRYKKSNTYTSILILFVIFLLVRYLEYVLIFAFIGGVLLYIYHISKKAAINSKYRQIDQDIHNVDVMTGIEFEDYLCHIFRKQGYQVKTTPVTNDYGADLVLRKDGQVTVVQAKRYSGKVGVKAVQEVNTAMPYYRAGKAIVVTNNYFTPNAVNLARANGVQLIDRRQLVKMMKGVSR